MNNFVQVVLCGQLHDTLLALAAYSAVVKFVQLALLTVMTISDRQVRQDTLLAEVAFVETDFAMDTEAPIPRRMRLANLAKMQQEVVRLHSRTIVALGHVGDRVIGTWVVRRLAVVGDIIIRKGVLAPYSPLQTALVEHRQEALRATISVVQIRPVVDVIETREIAVTTVLVEPLITMDAFIQTVVSRVRVRRAGITLNDLVIIPMKDDLLQKTRFEMFENGMTSTLTERFHDLTVIPDKLNGSLHSHRTRRNTRSVRRATIRPRTILGTSTAVIHVGKSTVHNAVRNRSLAIKKVFAIFANTTELAVRWNKCTLKISKFLAPRAKLDGRTTRVRACGVTDSRGKKFPRNDGRPFGATAIK